MTGKNIGKDSLVKYKESFYSAHSANSAQQLISTVLRVLFMTLEYLSSSHKTVLLVNLSSGQVKIKKKHIFLDTTPKPSSGWVIFCGRVQTGAKGQPGGGHGMLATRPSKWRESQGCPQVQTPWGHSKLWIVQPE